MDWQNAPDIKKRLNLLVKELELDHVKIKNVFCVRSVGSKSRARARIWSFPRLWQQVLHLEPHYIVEVLSEKFDNLSEEEKIKILIHELMHIPKTFSGALLAHRGRGRRIDRKTVEKIYTGVIARRKWFLRDCHALFIRSQ